MDVPASLPTLPEPSGSAGELVVQTGRLSGTRRPLRRPLTLLGQALGCDVRLNAEGVSPLECAILHDQAGSLLHALGGEAGVKVNGQPVHAHRLATGDMIEIAGFRFAVELEAPKTSERPSADAVLLDREREAVRIQTAAVAAQQAALTEEEARLDQRSMELTRQEAQLAGHLEERQRRLDGEEERLRQERVAFEAECAAAREQLARREEDLGRQASELDGQRQQADRQRQRLHDLRRRLFKRAQRHWQAREAKQAQRERAVVAHEQRLSRERASVRSFQERLHGELELGRRQLRDEAQELLLAQQRWQEALEQDRQEHQQRLAELDGRVAEVTTGEQALEEERQRWRQQQARLEREEKGLQARIAHQRAQLDALQREAAALREKSDRPAGPIAPIPMAPALLPEPAPATGSAPHLRNLAGMLGDQRTHLAEQWRRLLEVQQDWEVERATILAELEANAERLARRDHDLAAAEERIDRLRADLERQQENLAAARGGLEGWQARFVAEQASWQTQRDERLAQLDERERLLEQRSGRLDEEQARSARLVELEATSLQAARASSEEARKQYSRLWQDCDRMRGVLAERERRLAGEALALERLREELIHAAPNSARADGRLQKLSKREVARQAAEARSVEAERHRQERERARLDEEAQRLGQLEETVLARQRDWSRQVAAWERQRLSAEVEEARRQEEQRRLRTRHALDERQVRQLREEVERLARVLIEEAPEPPAQQAA